MPSHADTAKKVLASIKKPHTKPVQVQIALVHATLEAAEAMDRQTAAMKKLWHEPLP